MLWKFRHPDCNKIQESTSHKRTLTSFFRSSSSSQVVRIKIEGNHRTKESLIDAVMVSATLRVSFLSEPLEQVDIESENSTTILLELPSSQQALITRRILVYSAHLLMFSPAMPEHLL